MLPFSSSLPSKISVQIYSGYQLALIDRFYKSCGLRVHCHENEIVFGLRLSVEKNSDYAPLLAAVRFIPVSEQYWLMRNVCVAESHRRQGLASQLLSSCLPLLNPSRCYCYARDYLYPLYHALGFQQLACETVPAAVAEEYSRYLKNKKDLWLFGYETLPASSAIDI